MSRELEQAQSALDSGLIEFVCVAHTPDETGPSVTPLRGSWCYCAAAPRAGHRWRQIEPVSRERLERHVLPERLRPIT